MGSHVEVGDVLPLMVMHPCNGRYKSDGVSYLSLDDSNAFDLLFSLGLM